MRVLMFGRGVIATIYGWALEQAGHEVRFLVRPGRAAEYGDRVELDLLDARRRPWGERIRQTWSTSLIEHLEADHDFDVIVVSVGHHHLSAAAEFLAPRVGSAAVLIFGNVWDEPADAVAPLPLDRLAWGFPQAGGGFDGDGVLHAAVMRRVLFGTLGGEPTSRESQVRQLFADAGLRVSEQPDLRGWLLIHFAADAGVHSQGVQLGSLSDLLGRPASFREALLTSRELLPVLEARGVDLRRHRSSTALFRAPAGLAGHVLSLVTARVPLARVSLAAHTDPRAEEPRRVVEDMLAEARRQGVPTPRLDRAAAALRR